MRINLLPLTRKQSLVFWQTLGAPPVRTTPRLDEKVIERASKIWEGFQTSDKKWRQTIARWGNIVLERTPIEEWALKTVPALEIYKREVRPTAQALGSGNTDGTGKVVEKYASISDLEKLKVPSSEIVPVKLVYPSNLSSFEQAQEKLNELATTGLKEHRRKMILCAIGLPLTLPVAVIPLVPNLPAFYLMYRIWSNWMAYKGAKHIKYILDQGQIEAAPLRSLDVVYEKGVPETGLSDDQVERINRIFDSARLHQELFRAMDKIRNSKDAKEKTDAAKASQKEDQ